MNDRIVVRILISGLIAIVLLAMGLASLLLLDDHDAAAVGIVAGFGTTALGGLIGLLANTRTEQDPVVATALEQAHAAGAAETETLIHELAARPTTRTRPKS